MQYFVFPAASLRCKEKSGVIVEVYLSVKKLHMLCAVLTVLFFAGRLLLDACGRTGWRSSIFRWLPHINDTILLTLAMGLLALGGWQPGVHKWLGIKILLVGGYIISGVFALNLQRSKTVRLIAVVLAVVQLAAIFYLARFKPW